MKARLPSFCLYGPDEAVFDRFAGLIAALCERHPRFTPVLMAVDAKARERLARRYPAAIVVGSASGLGRFGASWVKRLKIKCFIALGGLEKGEPPFFAALRRRAVPIVVLAAEPAALPSVDHYVVGDAAALRRLEAAGVEPARASVVEALAGPEAIAASASARIVDILSPFLARHGALARSRRGGPLRRIETMLLRRLSPWRIRRIESVEALRDVLGTPQRILCLGNGPSSEEPALAEIRYDRLFRVNDRWLDRGFLAKPDMVFTGSRKTLSRVRGAIFGLSSIDIEEMLLRKWLPYAPFRRLTYFTPERAGVLPPKPAGGVEPTNGVIMLATAVALQPRSLVVAGIDLFADPRGAYPGGDGTPNAYAAAHDRDSELQMILRILGGHRGELIVVGDVLKAHWEAHERRRALSAP